MPALFGRGGPLQGPRLLIAFFVVLLLIFYLRTPSDSPQPHRVVPATEDGQNPQWSEGQEKGNAVTQNPNQPASLGELPVEQKEDKAEKESMSDRLFDYLKGHSSHEEHSHSPIPHDEINPPSASLAPAVAEVATSKDPICANIPNLSDILVVVRTSASDLYNHLPAHFLTDLRCVDFLLFSTVHQNIGPYTVYDALANLSDSRRSKHKDFELYDKLQAAQNAVADLSQLREDTDHNLERWTILPHVLATYKMRPDKKWYFFIESDTYISVSNVLPWLNKMDHTRPLYGGAPVMIGDVELAHSGSGILLSNAAAEKLSNLSEERMDAWEDMIGNSCCGDKILAEALKQAGIRLHRSFPMIQGETPFSLDWSERHWCRPSMTWHRMTPHSIDMVYQFESAWVKKHATGDGAEVPPMLFKDYFQTFLIPLIRISQNRTDWDNLASSLTYTDQSRAQYAHYSFDACRAACDLRHSCVQYAWEPNKCRLGTVVKWGESVKSDKRMMSGWLMQRVEKFGETVEKGTCPADDVYIMPGEEREVDSKAEKENEEPEEPEKDALQLEEEQIKAKEAEEARAKAEEKAKEQAAQEKAEKAKAKEMESAKQKEKETSKQMEEQKGKEGGEAKKSEQGDAEDNTRTEKSQNIGVKPKTGAEKMEAKTEESKAEGEKTDTGSKGASKAETKDSPDRKDSKDSKLETNDNESKSKDSSKIGDENGKMESSSSKEQLHADDNVDEKDKKPKAKAEPKFSDFKSEFEADLKAMQKSKGLELSKKPEPVG